MPTHEGQNGYHLPDDVEVEQQIEWAPEIATAADYDSSEFVVQPDTLTVASSSSDAVPTPYTPIELSDFRDRRFDAVLPIPDSQFTDY